MASASPGPAVDPKHLITVPVVSTVHICFPLLFTCKGLLVIMPRTWGVVIVFATRTSLVVFAGFQMDRHDKVETQKDDACQKRARR